MVTFVWLRPLSFCKKHLVPRLNMVTLRIDTLEPVYSYLGQYVKGITVLHHGFEY